ncbi:hypothetical protein N5079_08105, partial [Planotetraspora sp. A-T 1434]|nr:hypothetical protein [Planotetraspora sp. A-T 1434]
TPTTPATPPAELDADLPLPSTFEHAPVWMEEGAPQPTPAGQPSAGQLSGEQPPYADQPPPDDTTLDVPPF